MFVPHQRQWFWPNNSASMHSMEQWSPRKRGRRKTLRTESSGIPQLAHDSSSWNLYDSGTNTNGDQSIAAADRHSLSASNSWRVCVPFLYLGSAFSPFLSVLSERRFSKLRRFRGATCPESRRPRHFFQPLVVSFRSPLRQHTRFGSPATSTGGKAASFTGMKTENKSSSHKIP